MRLATLKKIIRLTGIVSMLIGLIITVWVEWPGIINHESLSVSTDRIENSALNSIQKESTYTYKPVLNYSDLLITIVSPKRLLIDQSQIIELVVEIIPKTNELDNKDDFNVKSPPTINPSAGLEGEKSEGGIEARLELPGMTIYPQGTINQTLIMGSPSKYTWKISTKEHRKIKGTLWLYMVGYTNPEDSIQRIPIMARQININVHDIFGLPYRNIKLFSILCLIAGFLVLI